MTAPLTPGPASGGVGPGDTADGVAACCYGGPMCLHNPNHPDYAGRVLAWEHSDPCQRWAFHGDQRFVLTHCYDPEKDDTEWELEYLPRPHARVTLRYFPTLTDALAECDALATPSGPA